MQAEQSFIRGIARVASRKIAVGGIAVGTAQTLEESWSAKSAVVRALDTRRSNQERIAAGRAAPVYGRRAIFKAGSTVVAQVPGYGTVAALAVDCADAVLRMAEGNQKKLEQKASLDPAGKRKSTEAFHAEHAGASGQRESLRKYAETIHSAMIAATSWGCPRVREYPVRRSLYFVRRNVPLRTIDARKPPFPSSAASAPGPKARSIQ